MSDEPSSEVSELLQTIGWSQRELARRLNITDSTVRSWISGRRMPPPPVVEWLQDIARRIQEAPATPPGWG
jgi:DNA-binding transcriptional regulator YiaG